MTNEMGSQSIQDALTWNTQSNSANAMGVIRQDVPILITLPSAGVQSTSRSEKSGAASQSISQAAFSFTSIIPDPGPPPNEAPRTEEIPISGEFGSIVFAEDEVFFATDLPTVFRGGSGTTIQNDGIVWLDTERIQVFFAVSFQPEINNTGTIYLKGNSQVSLNYGLARLENSGDIFSISEAGWARVVQANSFGLVENSGIIAAQTFQSTNFSGTGNATAIDSPNGVLINNSATGQILAEAPDLAIAILSNGSDLDTGDPSVTNFGLIEAQATTAEGISYGILVSQVFGPANGQPAFNQATIVNHGTIRGEFAIFGTDGTSPRTNPVEQIFNEPGGVIDGTIFLDRGADLIENEGLIIGTVLMGDGNDTFSNLGRVDGVVDLGWQEDLYEGSDFSDVATGNRGDDVLIGFGGNDLLLGAFGDDTLSGGADNDGLFGEFGNDFILTFGADFVDGGTGSPEPR
ncbi:MAG: hypothetical protein AAF559_04110 [Pseudomonadota bacterium]